MKRVGEEELMEIRNFLCWGGYIGGNKNPGVVGRGRPYRPDQRGVAGRAFSLL